MGQTDVMRLLLPRPGDAKSPVRVDSSLNPPNETSGSVGNEIALLAERGRLRACLIESHLRGIVLRPTMPMALKADTMNNCLLQPMGMPMDQDTAAMPRSREKIRVPRPLRRRPRCLSCLPPAARNERTDRYRNGDQWERRNEKAPGVHRAQRARKARAVRWAARGVVSNPTERLMRVGPLVWTHHVILMALSDYDEGGALDALMTLHGDRPQASPSKESGPSGASPTQPTGSKRPAPVSPTISPSTTTKKPRGDATGPSPSPKPASAPTKRTVIEVLNAERIGSPAIRPGSSLSVEGGRVGSGAPGGSPLPRVDDIDKAAPTPVASDVKASEPNSEQAAAAPGASDAKEQSEKSEVESSVVEPIPGAGTEESTDSTDQPAVDETKTAPEIRDESRPATPPLPPPEQVNGDGDVEMGKEAESNNNEQKEAAPQPATEEKPGEAQGESGGDEMDVDGSESAEGKTSKVNGEAPADTIETEDSKASAEDAVEEAPEAAELAA